MPDEEVRLDIQETRVICDSLTFNLFSTSGFRRKYAVGEVPGVIFPLDTVVTMLQLEECQVRLFPPITSMITNEDREAHFRSSKDEVIWRDFNSEKGDYVRGWSWLCISIGRGCGKR